MTPNTVAEIKACEGVYRAADVARQYGVHRSTVTRIWQGQRRAEVRPAPELPNVDSRLSGDYLADAITVLEQRGRSVDEIADELGVSKSTVYQYKGIWC